MAFETQRKTYVDEETGEAHVLVAVPASQLNRTRTTGGFFMGYQAAIDQLADSPDLTDGDIRVLMKLFAKLDYENFIHLEIKQIAEEMGRSREAVSRSVSRLVQAGVLHRGPRVGRAYTYRMDTGTAFRGKPDARHRVQRELDSRGWEVVEGDSGAAQDGSVSGDQVLPGL